MDRMNTGGTSVSASPGPAALPLAQASPLRELYRNFLYRFIVYIKARKLYPPHHNRVIRSLKEFQEAVHDILCQAHSVSIYSHSDSVRVEEEEFGGNDKVFVDLAVDLTKRNIRCIRIEEGVIAPDLEGLAVPLMPDPRDLQEAGGPQKHLAEQGVSSVFVEEFSFEAQPGGPTADSVVPAGQVEAPEQGAKPLETEDQWQITQLLAHRGICAELTLLSQVIEADPDDTEGTQRTCEWLVSMVRKVAEYREQAEDLPDFSLEDVVARGLRVLRMRLARTLENQVNASKTEITGRIAEKMMASPETMIEWLSYKTDHPESGRTTDATHMMTAVFSRAGEEDGTIRLGEKEFQVLEAPVSRVEPARARPGKRARDEVTLAALAEQYRKMKDSLGDNRFVLDAGAVAATHFHLLMELLSREEDLTGRKALLVQIGATIARLAGHRPGQADLGLSFASLERLVALPGTELSRVIMIPPLMRWALGVFAQGQARFCEPLLSTAREEPGRFAEVLGAWVLESDHRLSEEDLQTLIYPCENAMDLWLLKKAEGTVHPAHWDRLVALTLASRSPLVVPVIGRLLQTAAGKDYTRLVHALVPFDNREAVQVLRDQLDHSDALQRETVLNTLGNCHHPLAEEVLIEAVERSFRLEERAQDQIVALGVLGRCGKEKAREMLQRLRRRFSLLWTKKGRVLRSRAAEALEQLRERA